TLSVTLSEMIYHTKMVSKAVKRALVVTDMPFLSYHTGIKDAIANCGRCIKEGRAQAVKIEGGNKRSELIKRVVESEIPVMGHIGLTPQSIHKLGGFKVQGKDKLSIEKLIEDAVALEESDVF
ncbi:MAG: 3-methyl-2-oxobutanoate hydroxymethyltransferase, partial [Acidobacteria bacterium]|nr:3-methyl-2-oxobutanoate hydroxymethyltransferase [Acidobacteriota bacterium]